MNKITNSNYNTIANEINDAIMNDNPRKIEDYSKYIFDCVIKKCINDDHFINDYIMFLMAFNGIISQNIYGYINQFIY